MKPLTLFRLPTIIRAHGLGSEDLVAEVDGESIDPEPGDLLEVTMLVRVGSYEVGSKKMDKRWEFIDDPSRQTNVFVCKGSARVIRHVPEAELADEWRKRMIREEDERQVEQRPRAV